MAVLKRVKILLDCMGLGMLGSLMLNSESDFR